MPRYFFNLVDDGRTIPDDIGAEFEHALEVRRYAVALAARLAHRYSDGAPPAYLSVADARRSEVFRVVPKMLRRAAESSERPRGVCRMGDVAPFLAVDTGCD